MPTTTENGRRDIVTTLVVLLLLSVVGAGVGFATGSLLGGINTASTPTDGVQGKESPPAESSDNTSEEGDSEAGEATHHDAKILPFPPILTTLAEPKGKWIRLEGSLLASVDGDTPPERLAEESAEHILSYLRSVRLNQLESPSGVLGLRDDIDETVKTMSGGEVQGVLIHGLVVE